MTGVLSCVVWPTFIGLAESTDGALLREVTGDQDYERGQITWRTRTDGLIVGWARIYAPKGVYTHFVFCTGPSENVLGVEQMEHPIVFDRPGFVDVDPISNQDVLPRDV